MTKRLIALPALIFAGGVAASLSAGLGTGINAGWAAQRPQKLPAPRKAVRKTLPRKATPKAAVRHKTTTPRKDAGPAKTAQRMLILGQGNSGQPLPSILNPGQSSVTPAGVVTILPNLFSCVFTFQLNGSPGAWDAEPYRAEIQWRPQDPTNAAPWKRALPFHRVEDFRKGLLESRYTLYNPVRTFSYLQPGSLGYPGVKRPLITSEGMPYYTNSSLIEADNLDGRMAAVLRGLDKGVTYDFRVLVYPTKADYDAHDTTNPTTDLSAYIKAQGQVTTRTDDVPRADPSSKPAIALTPDTLSYRVQNSYGQPDTSGIYNASNTYKNSMQYAAEQALGAPGDKPNAEIRFAPGVYHITLPSPAPQDGSNPNSGFQQETDRPLITMKWNGSDNGYITIRSTRDLGKDNASPSLTATQSNTETVVIDAADPGYDRTGAGLWTRQVIGGTATIDGSRAIYRSVKPYPRRIGALWYEPLDRPTTLAATRTQTPNSVYPNGNPRVTAGPPKSVRLWDLNGGNLPDPIAYTDAGYPNVRPLLNRLQILADHKLQAWYQDETGYIYVFLPGGIDPNTVKMKVPTRSAFLDLSGADEVHPRHHIVVENLVLQHFDGHDRPGAIAATNHSSDLVFRNNRFYSMGCAIDGLGTIGSDYGVQNRSNRLTIVNNWVIEAGEYADTSRPVEERSFNWRLGKYGGELAFLRANGDQVSVANNRIHGVFDAIGPWAVAGQNGEAHTISIESAAWEAVSNKFSYVSDDACEMRGDSMGHLIEGNDFYRCLQGVSFAPLNLGPSFFIRNTFLDEGNLPGEGGYGGFWKMGSDTTAYQRDNGFKGFYNNTVIAKGTHPTGSQASSHSLTQQSDSNNAFYSSYRSAPGWQQQGVAGNFEFINNYVHADDVVFNNLGMHTMTYPYVFDFNFYALRYQGDAYPKWFAYGRYTSLLDGTFTTSGNGGNYQQQEDIVYSSNWRCYPSLAAWQAGTAYGTNSANPTENLPAWDNTTTPHSVTFTTDDAFDEAERASLGKPAVTGAHPRKITFTYKWVHDPHSRYVPNPNPDTPVEYAADAPGGDYTVDKTFPGANGATPLPNVTFDTGRTYQWECAKGTAPTVGFYELNPVSHAAQPPGVGVKRGVKGVVGTPIDVWLTISDPDGTVSKLAASVTGPAGQDVPSSVQTFSDNSGDVTFTPDAEGTYTVTATVTDASGATGSDSAPVTVTLTPTPPPVTDGLTIKVTGNKDTAVPGEPVVYTVVIGNPTSRKMANVNLKVTLPGQVTVNTASAVLDGNPYGITATGNVITVPFESVPPGATHTLSVTAFVK